MVVPIWMLKVAPNFIIRYGSIALEEQKYCLLPKATSPHSTNRGQGNRGVTHESVIAIHFLVFYQGLLLAVSSSFYLRVCKIDQSPLRRLDLEFF